MGFYCHLVYYAQLLHFGLVGIGSSQDGRRQPLGYLLVFGGMQCFLVCGQLNWNAIGFAGIFLAAALGYSAAHYYSALGLCQACYFFRY